MSDTMKVFVCTDHKRFYPIGAASVIVAKDETTARVIFSAELDAVGLGGSDFTLKELDLKKQHVVILVDGDY